MGCARWVASKRQQGNGCDALNDLADGIATPGQICFRPGFDPALHLHFQGSFSAQCKYLFGIDMGAAGNKQATKQRAKRQRSSSGSGSDSSGSDGEVDKAAMLAALQAHGMAMLGMPGPEDAEGSGGAKAAGVVDSDDEEDSDGSDAGDSDNLTGDDDFDDGWGEGDEMVTDSEEEEVLGASSRPGE